MSSNCSNCKFYDKKSNTWCLITAMKLNRSNTACTLFEGKIVVFGGFGYLNSKIGKVKSIKAYDHYENPWSY